MIAENNHRRQEYLKVKHLIETEYITSFSQIIEQFEKKTLIADLKMNWKPLTRRLTHLGYFNLDEIAHFADLLGVDPNKLAQLAFQEMREKAQKHSKKYK